MNKQMTKECIVYLKKESFRRRLILLAQIALLSILIFGWELAAKTGLIDKFLFSYPSQIWELFMKYLMNGEILKHVSISVLETVLGLVIGTSLGIGIAIILWISPFLARLLDPFLVVLNALPKTALAPIFIIWIGTNLKGIVFVAVSISLVLTIMSSYNFFTNVEEDKVKMLKSYQATKFQILRYLVLPSNVKNMISMTKINIGMAWIGVIVGEFIVSRAGIGYLINYGAQVFKLDLVMMGVFVLILCTLLMYGAVNLLEKFVYYVKERKRT